MTKMSSTVTVAALPAQSKPISSATGLMTPQPIQICVRSCAATEHLMVQKHATTTMILTVTVAVVRALSREVTNATGQITLLLAPTSVSSFAATEH